MNILMVNVPFSGHVNPTLTLAKELVRRGHNVSYILTNEWRERIEAAGARFIPYLGCEDFKIVFKNGKPKNIFKAVKAWRYAYQTVVAVGAEYDLLIYEFFTFTAFAAAKKVGIRTVRQFSTFAIDKNNISSILAGGSKEVALMNNKLLLGIITKIVCGKIELTTPNIISEITDVPVELNIVYTSAEFQINNSAFDDRYVFVGPSIGERNCGTVIPYDKLKGDIIYISMGTLQNEQLDFYKKCIAAFGNREGVSVVMSIGKNIAVSELGEIPQNCFVYNFVPQLEVLKRSTLFISHGGMNSVNEGLYYGNRFIVIPMDMDQYVVAERICELNLGYRLNISDITPDLLMEKAELLLSDTEAEQAVDKMSKIMQSAGGVGKAADCIEKYIKTNKNILSSPDTARERLL